MINTHHIKLSFDKFLKGFHTLLCGISFLFLLSACTKDSAEPREEIDCSTLNPVYLGDIVVIINRTCAYAGCHGTLSPYGDYTSFAGLKPSLENGRFKERVLTIGDMPPTNVTDSLRLEPFELELLRCWLENGFPEE